MKQVLGLTYVLYDTTDFLPPLSSTDEHRIADLTGTALMHRALVLCEHALAFSTLVPVFLVVALVSLLLARRELQTLFLLIGVLFNEGVNHLLKHWIREPRPAGSYKHGFGMPSDHAQFMTFLAVYTTFYVLCHVNFRRHSLLYKLSYALLIHTLMAFTSYARLWLKVHTAQQVVVGSVIGWLFGVSYFVLVQSILRPLCFDRLQCSALGEYFALKDNTALCDVLQLERELSMRLQAERVDAKQQRTKDKQP
mmetsp:Transcript_42918/g.108348  ORF Transcript_42918/g.108348 Transcript_42918/m.108348 type:complete len:252 (+) Transcript_42918:451-1206(+)